MSKYKTLIRWDEPLDQDKTTHFLGEEPVDLSHIPENELSWLIMQGAIEVVDSIGQMANRVNTIYIESKSDEDNLEEKHEDVLFDEDGS